MPPRRKSLPPRFRKERVTITNDSNHLISARSISEEFSTNDTNKFKDEDVPHTSSAKAREREERDEETIKVYDGNKRRMIFRLVGVSFGALRKPQGTSQNWTDS